MADVKFCLGMLVSTPAALQALAASKQNATEFLLLHQTGIWGELDVADCQLNDEAIAHEGDRDQQQRVLSSYKTSLGAKIWIITEWDRSVTTILLPEEY